MSLTTTLELDTLKEFKEKLNNELKVNSFKKMEDLKKQNRSFYSKDYFISRLVDIDVELRDYNNYFHIMGNIQNHFFNLVLNSEYRLMVNIQCCLNLLVDLTLQDNLFDETNLLTLRNLSIRLFKYRKEDGIINIGIELDRHVVEQMEYFINLIQIDIINIMIKQQEKS